MHGYEYVFRMNGQTNPSAFELPANAPPRIRRFHELWMEKGAGALPDASHFDVTELGEDFPLLARIGVDGQTLIWRDFGQTQCWPFGPPVKDAPVEGSVPPLSVKRVIAAFQEIEGPDPGVLYLTNRNISKVEIWGIEAGAEIDLYDDLYARTAISWQQANQVPTEDADEIPYNDAEPFTTVTGIGYDNGEWGLELVHTWEAGLKRVSDESDLTTSSYHVFDVVGYYRPAPWIELRAGLFNIFDKRYLPANAVSTYATPEVPLASVAAGNPIESRIAPGFNATLSLTIKF